MKKNIFNLFFCMIAVVLLGSCSSTKEEMGDECVPLEDVFTNIKLPTNTNADKLRLSIYDEDTETTKGIITWVTDKVTAMVRSATLKIYLKIALN